MRKYGRLAALGVSVLMTTALAACGGASSATGGGGSSSTTEARTFAVKEEKAEEKKEEKTEEKPAQEAGAGDRAMPSAEAGSGDAASAAQSGGTAAEPEALKEIAADVNAAGQNAAGQTAEAAAALPLHLESNLQTHGWYDPAVNGNGYIAYAEVEEQRLFLAPEDAEKYPELEKTLEKFSTDRFARLKTELQEASRDNMEMFQAYPDMKVSENGHTWVRRADTEVLSFVSCVDMYYGGVHPDYFYGGYSYDVKTGKEIKLADVIKDPAALPELLDPVLSAENGEKYDLAAESIRQILKEKEADTYSFTVEQEGIRFWFSPYEISSYAAGMFTAELRFDEHPEIFTGKYQNAAKSWGRPCPNPEYEPITFFRDGKRREVSVSTEPGEYGAYEHIRVSLDGRETDIEQYGYGYTAHLLCRDGKYWLYLFNTEENDYSTLHVLDLSGDAPKEVTKLSGVRADYRVLKDYEWKEYDNEKAHEEEDADDAYRDVLITDPDHILLSNWEWLLSTYSASAEYAMQEDGTPLCRTDYYEISGHGEYALKLLKDTEFETADPETLAPKGSTALKAGTELTFYRTDGKSVVWFLTKNWKCVRVEVDNPEDYPSTVGGVDAEELFEGIIYAD